MITDTINSKLDLWKEYHNFYSVYLQNTNYTWIKPDDATRYKETIKNKNIITYTPEDFTYKRNSYGFRCDEFNNNDKIKILYGGCSITEGIGLPIEHTWAYFLNEHISNDIKNTFSFYNISEGGVGINAIVRYIYVTLKYKNFIPDFILLLLPQYTRTQFFIKKLNNDESYIEAFNYGPGWIPEHAKKEHNNITQGLLIRDRINESFKNILLLKLLLESLNIPFYFMTWDYKKITYENELIHNLSFVDLIKHYSCDDIVHNFLDVQFFSEEVISNNIEKMFSYNKARDGMHPGPNVHYDFSKRLYSVLKTKNDFNNLLTVWGNK